MFSVAAWLPVRMSGTDLLTAAEAGSDPAKMSQIQYSHVEMKPDNLHHDGACYT